VLHDLLRDAAQWEQSKRGERIAIDTRGCKAARKRAEDRGADQTTNVIPTRRASRSPSRVAFFMTRSCQRIPLRGTTMKKSEEIRAVYVFSIV
jgi:hypothetical protein